MNVYRADLHAGHHYVTVTSSWYVVNVIAQYQALARYEASFFHYHALCMDQDAWRVLTTMDLPGLRATRIEDFEDAPLLACKGSRTVAEYCWTVKSPFILSVLQSAPGVRWAVYLDADLYPFASLDPIWGQLTGADIVLSPHRFTGKLLFLDAPAGRYNAGMVSLRNTANARSAISWWSERSLEWCYYRDEDGKLGDQKYLLEFPARFQGVRECALTGVNVAPWNIRRFTPFERDGRVWLDEATPLCLYHFHQYSYLPDGSYVAVTDPVYDITPEDRRLIYEPYTTVMLAAEAEAIRAVPGFTPPRKT